MSLNLAGSIKLHLALEQVAHDYRGNTYGGLVLHVLKVTTFEKTLAMVTSSLELVDDETREAVFAFTEKIKPSRSNSTFWKASIDEMVQTAGLEAVSIWKERGFETNKVEFRNLQNLLFDTVLFNFVLDIHTSKENQVFVKKSIGQGIFGKLFGG